MNASDAAATPARVGGNTSLDQTATSKLEESLVSLHSEFKQYREDKTKTDEVYTTTIEKLRKESSEARILNQKLAAQVNLLLLVSCFINHFIVSF